MIRKRSRALRGAMLHWGHTETRVQRSACCIVEVPVRRVGPEFSTDHSRLRLEGLMPWGIGVFF